MKEAPSSEQVRSHTRRWVQEVVVGWNFCPFAKSVFADQRLKYVVAESTDLTGALEAFLAECRRLDSDPSIETTLLIFSSGFSDFSHFLDLVDLVEALVEAEGYEGVYQVATFHPDYVFDGSDETDPANYTNRSPYPVLHLLREEALSQAIEAYEGDVEAIPETNIKHARQLGLAMMRSMLERATT